MSSVILALCELLCCDPSELQESLENPEKLIRVERFLKNHTLYTNYHNTPRVVKCMGLNIMDAKSTKAYNGYLDVTVQQHYYCRYRIKLKFPGLPLLIEYKKGHRLFFPLELLSIVDN